ncbi:MAG: heme ABC exporter ATP-binding protein CcmA, partial [Nitrospirae bacterium]
SNIVKKYQIRPVLNGINLELRSGELYVLFGENGAGKSTLVRIMAGLLTPTMGEVWIRDDSSENRIFYAGHRNSLYQDLTVLENLKLYASVSNNNLANGKIEELLDSFHLLQRRNDKVRELSQGMKRRLCLMRVFLSSAPLVLLDEPLSGLDPKWKMMLLDRFLELKEKGRTVFMVTHHIEEGLKIADRVGLIKRGRLEVDSDGSDVSEELIRDKLNCENA